MTDVGKDNVRTVRGEVMIFEVAGEIKVSSQGYCLRDERSSGTAAEGDFSDHESLGLAGISEMTHIKHVFHFTKEFKTWGRTDISEGTKSGTRKILVGCQRLDVIKTELRSNLIVDAFESGVEISVGGIDGNTVFQGFFDNAFNGCCAGDVFQT